ncbi:hypothetical protein [Methylorubrum populi]
MATFLQIRDEQGRKVALYTLEAEEKPPALPDGWVLELADATPLWAPPPDSVADYQFAGEAEARGIITAAECDAWVGRGEVPEALERNVERLIDDAETRRRVLLFLKGAKQFPRQHANTIALAAMFGLTEADQVDDFFTCAHRR